MKLREDINRTLADLASRIGLESLTLDAADSVMLGFDGDLEILVELDGNRGRLVLSSQLGVPPHDEGTRLHPLLLMNNALWNDLDLYFALDGSTGQVLVFRPVVAAGLDAAGLEGHLEEILQFAERWRDVVRAPRDALAASSAQPG